MISSFKHLVPGRLRAMRYLTDLALRQSGGRVYAGPFAGMRHPGRSIGSVLIPKLVGIYERELWEHIEAACASSPDLVIDIGAAEGYYAVGLSLKCPAVPVIAFEMTDSGRDCLREMVMANGVGGNVRILGKCEPEDLRKAISGAAAPFVVCDVEGYEDRLLDLALVPSLAKATIPHAANN
ncbi:MAG: hypothetical protein ACP5QA_16730 [Phycisphaerae bacterium]